MKRIRVKRGTEATELTRKKPKSKKIGNESNERESTEWEERKGWGEG